MLTGYQCETVAFVHNGEIVCPDCAVAATSAITVAKADRGYDHGGGDLSPLSRYSLDEYNGERAYEHVECELGLTWQKDPEAFDKAVEDYPAEACGDCGREID